MNRPNEKGAILVAGLLILALLSLLGAGALLNATLDSRMVGNLGKSKRSFYAAEAALEVGVGNLITAFKETLAPIQPNANSWVVPAIANGAPFDGAAYPPGSTGANSYALSYNLSNPRNISNPSSIPNSYSFSTVNAGQQLMNYAYDYRVTAIANSANGIEREVETIRVLETPLVQYYVFFNDDLSWHHGPPMNSWGRIHTNGKLYFANQGDFNFRNYDQNANLCPNTLTVHNTIVVGSYLDQAGGILSRATNPVYVRVRNMSTVPAGSPSPAPPSGDCENLNVSIVPSTQAVQENRFIVNNVAHVRTGVDNLPTVTFKNIKRTGAVTGSGFYEDAALNPQRPTVDGMLIDIDSSDRLRIRVTLNGSGTVDVTNLVKNYKVDNAVYCNVAAWSSGARMRADGTAGSTAGAGSWDDMPVGSIVYCPEQPVIANKWNAAHTAIINFSTASAAGCRGAATGYNTAEPANATYARNPWYPPVLETADGRELPTNGGKKVDLTVIDMQQLQWWYNDYLNYRLLGTVNPGTPVSPNDHMLLIYATRTRPGTDSPVTGTGVNALQAIKLIGSDAGRTRRNSGDRQTSPTYLYRTTLVTPEPVYFEGDFNVPNSAANVTAPGGVGSAVVCDAATFLSGAWGLNHWDITNNAHPNNTTGNQAVETTFNTAVFAGRYNFRTNPSASSAEEAGIHNFTRFQEAWGTGVRINITGCLINLWFSERATAPHADPNDYYDPPTRNYGWDVGFANLAYWPPYVPSSYSIERQVWQEN